MVSILGNIEEYARINNIPIMEKEGIEFLTEYIKKNNIKRILELGTAIGYSSIKMALVNSDIHVTTIERDELRYNQAVKNIEKIELERQITVIHDDIFNVDLVDKYDLIFIDAAKSQYIKFFTKFQDNLVTNGVFISDNLNFHGLINEYDTLSRNVRGLVRKLKLYLDFLDNNQKFKTEYINIGDGLAISKKSN